MRYCIFHCKLSLKRTYASSQHRSSWRNKLVRLIFSLLKQYVVMFFMRTNTSFLWSTLVSKQYMRKPVIYAFTRWVPSTCITHYDNKQPEGKNVCVQWTIQQLYKLHHQGSLSLSLSGVAYSRRHVAPFMLYYEYRLVCPFHYITAVYATFMLQIAVQKHWKLTGKKASCIIDLCKLKTGASFVYSTPALRSTNQSYCLWSYNTVQCVMSPMPTSWPTFGKNCVFHFWKQH